MQKIYLTGWNEVAFLKCLILIRLPIHLYYKKCWLSSFSAKFATFKTFEIEYFSTHKMYFRFPRLGLNFIFINQLPKMRWKCNIQLKQVKNRDISQSNLQMNVYGIRKMCAITLIIVWILWLMHQKKAKQMGYLLDW